jgi:hypothetical protein
MLAANFTVDAVEYASRANAVLGIRDSGKTYTATMIAERLFEHGIPFFAFDPIGRWRFLRSPGTAKDSRGYPVVVLGGAAPDLPLTPESAPKMIRAAMQSGVSMVIDLYDVKLSKGDWRKIVRSSIETILYENEEHGGGLRHVFLEEAAEFVPQRVYDGQTYAAVEKLARMGGNAGVGVTLINQRAEEVNKAVLELCDNLLLHRQRGKNSLLSLRKWLEAGNVNPPKEITDSIADLPTGECWAWFREVGKPVRIKVSAKCSFDPNRREMAKKAGAAPQAVDISAFVAKMRAALEGKKPAPTVKVQGGYQPEGGGSRPAPPKTGSGVMPPKEKQVNEKEAKALREENAILKTRVQRLEGLLAKVPVTDATPPQQMRKATVGDESVEFYPDMDAIYAEVKRRAVTDPGVLQLLRAVPEIELKVTRQKVQMTDETLTGRLAGLIAGGFFDDGATGSAAHTELQRLGRGSAKPNVYRECDKLATMGFLTKEPSGGYKAVEGMKVNVVES